MARQNNIPQFDSSDTNISNAPANGFSANTTIYSGQVNGAIRWSSFAVTALLNAIANNTTETGSYEYTKNGATGVDTLSGQISTDLKNIIKKYTFDTGGTFNGEVTFSGTTNFNTNISFQYSSPRKGISTKGNVTGAVGNQTRDYIFSYDDPLTNQDYFYKVFEPKKYKVQSVGGDTFVSSYGKWTFKMSKGSTNNIITFADGEYTVKPYYTHHIYVYFVPNNYVYVKMNITTTLGTSQKIDSVYAIRTTLNNNSFYVASGIVKDSSNVYPITGLHIDKDTMRNNVVRYLNFSGKDEFEIPFDSAYNFTVEDIVFRE